MVSIGMQKCGHCSHGTTPPHSKTGPGWARFDHTFTNRAADIFTVDQATIQWKKLPLNREGVSPRQKKACNYCPNHLGATWCNMCYNCITKELCQLSRLFQTWEHRFFCTLQELRSTVRILWHPSSHPNEMYSPSLSPQPAKSKQNLIKNPLMGTLLCFGA